jgi:phosphoglycerate kinase
MTFKTLDNFTPIGKRILVRVDLNVPMANGEPSDSTRIERILPTIIELSNKGGKVILLSHFGRPKGKDAENSLKPVANALSKALDKPVGFVDDCIGNVAQKAISNMQNGDIICLENTRFYEGEKKNAPEFINALAELGDVYVNDAFSTAHRAHASTEGLAHKLPSFAGRTMQAELVALDKALGEPQRPVAAIVGGAKVSSKLDLLSNLVTKVDMLIIGGGMANTFLFALGHDVGKSLCEKDLAQTALDILAKAKVSNCEIVLPVDVVVAQEFKAHAASKTVSVDAVVENDMILDAGAASIAAINAKLDSIKTLVWNGPFGAFEMQPFDAATVAIAKHVADRVKINGMVAVGGGGDTVSALSHAGVTNDMTYISTAGGAFLEWMEGKPLPGVEALKSKINTAGFSFSP